MQGRGGPRLAHVQSWNMPCMYWTTADKRRRAGVDKDAGWTLICGQNEATMALWSRLGKQLFLLLKIHVVLLLSYSNPSKHTMISLCSPVSILHGGDVINPKQGQTLSIDNAGSEAWHSMPVAVFFLWSSILSLVPEHPWRRGECVWAVGQMWGVRWDWDGESRGK